MNPSVYARMHSKHQDVAALEMAKIALGLRRMS